MVELGPEGPAELLVRVVLWAPLTDCIDLYEHLCGNRHPFFFFHDKALAQHFRLVKKGLFFELFTLPINIRVLWKELTSLEKQGLVKAKFELLELPLLLICTAPSRRPRVDPFGGINAVLSMLPAWAPENEIAKVEAQAKAAAKARKKKKPKKPARRTGRKRK